jgi:AcrR family transcriptional regulator
MSERPVRAQRSDAKRNRARVLEVAAEVFANEGLAVPVHEIARRAGVGTGTVSRHFPTKESLFVAILEGRLRALTEEADRLAAEEDAGSALHGYLLALLREAAGNRAISDVLTGSGVDLETAGDAPERDVSGRLQHLLAAAQRAGQVRIDLNYVDLRVLVRACAARSDDPEAMERMVSVISAGMRPDAAGIATLAAPAAGSPLRGPGSVAYLHGHGEQVASGSADRAEPT